MEYSNSKNCGHQQVGLGERFLFCMSWEDAAADKVVAAESKRERNTLVSLFCSHLPLFNHCLQLSRDFHFSLSCIGEGNGNPLQCSCLENPREGGAWRAAIYGVAQSRTRLKWLSSSSSSSSIAIQKQLARETSWQENGVPCDVEQSGRKDRKWIIRMTNIQYSGPYKPPGRLFSEGSQPVISGTQYNNPVQMNSV